MVSGHTEVVTGTRRAPGARRDGGRRAGGPPGPGTSGQCRRPPRTGPAARPAPPGPARPPRHAPPASHARRACRGSGPPRRGGARPPQRPGAARSSRTPFVFLIVGLLGGGLLCLLLINTILDTGAYQITQLQQENATLVQQTQELQARIAQEESPAVLAGKASQLGMQEPGLLHFLDLRKGQDRARAHPRARGVGLSAWIHTLTSSRPWRREDSGRDLRSRCWFAARRRAVVRKKAPLAATACPAVGPYLVLWDARLTLADLPRLPHQIDIVFEARRGRFRPGLAAAASARRHR